MPYTLRRLITGTLSREFLRGRLEKTCTLEAGVGDNP
jgi:hypothetical protein